MVENLLAPLQHADFNRALAGTVLVAALCGTVGVFVVLRGLAYIGDALAHAVFPGAVAAYLLHINMLLGGMVAAVATVFAIAGVTRQRVRSDSAVVVVFVGMFALGMVLLSKIQNYKIDEDILAGNPMSINNQNLFIIFLLGGLVIALLLLFKKEFTLLAFDETEAKVAGLPVDLLNRGLLLLIAVSVVLAVQMVGTILVVSLLVTSSSTARLLGQRMGQTMLLAAGVGAFAAVVGLFVAQYFGVAPGATVVLVNTLVFLLVLLGAKKQNT